MTRIARRLSSAWATAGLALLLSAPHVRAQFWQTYAAGNGTHASDVKRCADGGYIILGSWDITNDNIHEDIVMKLDARGVPLWSYRYESPEAVTLNTIAEGRDGTIAATGVVKVSATVSHLVFLRLDSNGNVLSLRDVGIASGYPSMVTASDGSFVLTGAGVCKFATDGTPLWVRSYSRFIPDIVALDDGRLVGVGSARTSNGTYGCGIVLLTADGDVEWQLVHLPPPGARYFINSQVTLLPSGDIVFAADGTDAAGAPGLWVARVRLHDGVMWSRWLQGPTDVYPRPFGIDALNDRSLAIVAGSSWLSNTRTGGDGQNGEWLIGMSAEGDVIWQRVPAGAATFFSSTAGASPGGLVVVGNKFAQPYVDAVVAELDPHAWVGAHCSSTYDVSGAVLHAPVCSEPGTQIIWSDLTTSMRDIVYARRDGPAPSPCPDWPCLPMNCLGITTDPGSRPGRVGLRLEHEGGYGPVSISWDIDADGSPDATGNPVWVDLAGGPHAITASAVDSCAGPGPSPCVITVAVDVGSAPLGGLTQVSDVLAGDPPLLLTHDRIQFEAEPGAVAYHVYVDRIGSWYSPTDITGRSCDRRDWTASADGTAWLPITIPLDSWVDVTAADACGEGPPGRDSFGRSRDDTLAWRRCGASP